MNSSLLLLVPILLPVISALLIGFARPLQGSRAQRFFLTAVLALNALVVLAILFRGDISLELFRLTDRLPILFKADDLARLFIALAAIVFFLVGIYCPIYMRHEGSESRFYMFYLLVLGMVMGFGLSGNLITLYLFFEMATLLSMPMVMHSMKKEAVAAAFKYLVYSVAGAALSLIGFFFVYHYGTTLEFTPGGVLDMQRLVGNEEPMLLVTLLVIIGFGAKAGMFPLHAWLPIAHPAAPAPASALLSGLITKVGIFAVIRFVYYLVGPAFIIGTWVQTTWIGLALFTGIMGSLMALREPVLKRRLAYSTISQIGYIMFGLAILTAIGLVGAFLQIVFHSVAKNAVFLVAGVIILKTHKTEVADLRAIGKEMPIAIWCFALASLSLVGIPPLAGFIGKWFLAAGSLDADIGFFTLFGPALLLFSALLAAGYLLPIVINGFFPGAGHRPEQAHANSAHADSEHADSSHGDENGGGYTKYEGEFSLTMPLVVLAAAALIFGIFSGGLITLFEQIASTLL